MKTVKQKHLYFSILICVLVLNFLMSVSTAQTISGIQRLEKGIAGYENGNYLNAVINIEAALKEIPKDDKENLWDAHFYLGLAYLLLGDADESKMEFNKAQKMIKSKSPDPFVHSPKIVRMFKEALDTAEVDIYEKVLADYEAVEKLKTDAKSEAARICNKYAKETGKPVVPVIGTVFTEVLLSEFGIGLRDGPEASLFVTTGDPKHPFARIATDGTTKLITDRILAEKIMGIFGDKLIDGKTGAQAGGVLVLSPEARVSNDHLKEVLLQLMDQIAVRDESIEEEMSLIIFADDVPVTPTDGDFIKLFERVSCKGIRYNESYIPVYNNLAGKVATVAGQSGTKTVTVQNDGVVQTISELLATNVIKGESLETGQLIGLAINPSKLTKDERPYLIGLEIDGKDIELSDVLDKAVKNIEEILTAKEGDIFKTIDNQNYNIYEAIHYLETELEKLIDETGKIKLIDAKKQIARTVVFTLIERYPEFLEETAVYKSIKLKIAKKFMNEEHSYTAEEYEKLMGKILNRPTFSIRLSKILRKN